MTMPPISVFLVGTSLITSHTQSGPKAVSTRKKIPTSGDKMYLGARVMSTNENPIVIVIKSI